MSTYYWIVLIVVAFPFCRKQFVKWIVAPIRLKGKNPSAIDARREPTSLENLSPEMQEFLGTMIRQFAAEGFEIVANEMQPDPMPNMKSVQVLMVNRLSRHVAALIAAWGNNVRSMNFLVRSHFGDGTMLLTGANPQIGFFPPNPAKDPANFSWLTDAATLLEAHRRRLIRSGREAEARHVPAASEEADHMANERHANLRWFVQTGYYWRDEQGGFFRKTWKGAFLSTWKLTEPVKGYRIRRRDRKSRRLWNELGMADWGDSSQPSSEANTFDSTALAPPPLPPLPAHAAPDGAISLSYERALQWGEVRTERTGGEIVARGGRMTVADIAKKHVGVILSATFMVLVLGNYIFEAWLFWRVTRSLPALKFELHLAIAALACSAILAFDIWILLRAYRRLRRAPILWTRQGELFFTNAPGSEHDGRLKRREIASFRVMVERARYRSTVYRLEATRRGSAPPQLLFLSHDVAALNELKKSLLQVLGISVEPLAPP